MDIVAVANLVGDIARGDTGHVDIVAVVAAGLVAGSGPGVAHIDLAVLDTYLIS